MLLAFNASFQQMQVTFSITTLGAFACIPVKLKLMLLNSHICKQHQLRFISSFLSGATATMTDCVS